MPFLANDIRPLQGVLRRHHLRPGHAGRPLRVWVPGCADGRDAYAAADAILESLGRRWREVELCVFGTDSDEEALSRARAGHYPRRSRVRRFVRGLCRFAQHHLPQRPPFSRLDLVLARHTLAALPPPARRHALLAIHDAMSPEGVLLDPSGAAADAPELFTPLGREAGAFSRKEPSAAGRRAAAQSAGLHAKLKESEARFRLLFSRVEDAVLLQDDESGLIVEANAAAGRLFKAGTAELLGLDPKTLLAKTTPVRRLAGERRSKHRSRLPQYCRMDGSSFPAEATSSFLMREGRPCTLWTLRDATLRLRAEAGRRQGAEQEAFIGDLVHELRSPLTVIQGSAQTLRHGVRGTRARSSLLDFIESHTQRMGRLVDRLLDLSAVGAAAGRKKPSRVLLAGVLWELVGAFEPLAKRRGIVLQVDVPQDLAVMADPGDLTHVFGNLLDNAIKFSPRGAQVSVRAKASGREVLVSVKDSGGGIAPGDLLHVFERFFRGERTRSKKGTGLGLSIVHGIVKANGGRVYAENDPAGGAVFHVALPRPAR